MIIAIAGSTASGKTQLALELAAQLDGDILCADSRQIYRELDIGTAKPSLAEQKQVPHHLFDIADPLENFTLSQYCVAAETCFAQIQAQKRLPFLVGGTGLYFRSLLYDYTLPKVKPQPDLRAELESWDNQRLQMELQRVDPVSAERFHLNDRRRKIRALEVFQVTGQPISQSQNRSQTINRRCLYIGLRVPKERLYHRIQARIQTMLDQGLIEEVEALRQKYGKDLPLLQTLNYTEINAYLDQHWSLEVAKEKMFINTRQYARRQITWFKRDQEIKWFELHSSADLKQAAEWVKAALGKSPDYKPWVSANE